MVYQCTMVYSILWMGQCDECIRTSVSIKASRVPRTGLSSAVRETLLKPHRLRALPCTNRGTRQTEVLTQRRTRVVFLKETPPLQLRDHVGDEIRIGPRHMGCGHDKAVARAAYEHV